MRRRVDGWSLAVVAMTLALFVGALFVKGLTHDLFLEAGVFLLSVKLILMSYQHGVWMGQMNRKLDELKALLDQDAHRSNP
ncbi:MAG: hypothetical protein HYZ89_05875 [Candidatus Omnitrophica bacterium]|nr:hypothetical protein [Candidatus Omnitrophota bacterium]